MSDIVRLLRDYWHCTDDGCVNSEIIKEAATTIAGLQARLAQVSDARDSWERVARRIEDEKHDANARLAEVEVDARRYRQKIERHNAECESLCDREKCGYAPYPNRTCGVCPKDWIIDETRAIAQERQ